MTKHEKENILNTYKSECEIFFRPIVQDDKDNYTVQHTILEGMKIAIDALGLTAEANEIRRTAYKESQLNKE